MSQFEMPPDQRPKRTLAVRKERTQFPIDRRCAVNETYGPLLRLLRRENQSVAVLEKFVRPATSQAGHAGFRAKISVK